MEDVKLGDMRPETVTVNEGTLQSPFPVESGKHQWIQIRKIGNRLNQTQGSVTLAEDGTFREEESGRQKDRADRKTG